MKRPSRRALRQARARLRDQALGTGWRREARLLGFVEPDEAFPAGEEEFRKWLRSPPLLCWHDVTSD